MKNILSNHSYLITLSIVTFIVETAIIIKFN
jgi:hypothetical protein